MITQRQLNIAVAQASKRLPASARPNPTELRQQVLVQLINQALIVEAGKRRGITVTDTEIDAALAQSAATRKISVDKLYEHYAKDGISRNSLRREIADDIIVQKVQQQAVLQNARVSEEEIDAAMKGLKSAKGFLRSQLASRLNLRYMPDLDLRYDSLLTESMKLDALIAKGLNKN